MTTHTIPKKGGGGPLLSEAEEKDLTYWLNRKIEDLDGSRYPDRDREWIAAAQAELVSRGVAVDAAPAARTAAPARQPAQAVRSSAAQSTAMARAEPDALMSSSDAGSINAALRAASQEAHLITPATSCGSLPEGCEVAITTVFVDPNTAKDGPGDVADVGQGKLSLAGHVLKKIGAAAGLSWDVNASGRLDDASDPHYCHFRAVGFVKNFDGSVRTVSGEVEMDMREGSPQVVAMRSRTKSDYGFESQLRDTRLFLLRHAETKAKLRAIADMGMKRAYTAAELRKPFQVARLMWTGRTNDPELRRIFAEKQADAMIGASSMLYGRQQGAPPVRQVARQVHHEPQRAQLRAAPPVGSVPADDYDDPIPAAPVSPGLGNIEQPYPSDY